MEPRRKFLSALAAGLGGVWWSREGTGAAETPAQPTPQQLGALVARNFSGRSCAEAMLLSGLEYLDEPRELERIATPFGGGMGMGDHCGFYTAGLLVIGLASAGYPEGKASAVKIRQAFTEAWKKKWPLLCREIKEGQKAGKLAGGCGELGAAAGEILGGLLAPIAGDPRRARFARRT